MRTVADLHLRKDVPRCRGESEEEWIAFQRKCLDAIFDTDEPVYIAGDIFDKPRTSRVMEQLFFEALGDSKCPMVYVMPGNHDLLYNSSDISDTSYGTLVKSAHPKISTKVNYVPYGTTEPVRVVDDKILMVHTLTFEKDSDVPFGVQKYETARTLLKKYPDYEVILVGDMHKPFHVESKGRHVINCGSMTVQSINESDYKHGYWDETLFTPFNIPMDIIDERGTKVKKNTESLDAFITLMQDKYGNEDEGLDFIKILSNTLTKDVIHDKVGNVVKKWIQEVNV